MPPSPNVSSIAMTVVWSGLVIGLILGAVGQVSRFCVRGAIADWFVFGGRARLVSWLLAAAVGSIVLQVLIGWGLFDATRAVAWSNRFLWLSYLVGGLVFGFGMVLTGGCPQRSLVKAGEGNLRSLVVLIVTALVAMMTLKGVLAEFRASVLDRHAATLAGPQDLGSLVGGLVSAPSQVVRWALAVMLLAAVAVLAWRSRASMNAMHWVGGIVVGLLVPASFLATGYLGFVAEHPETLEAAWIGTQTRRPEGLSFSAPLAHTMDLLTLWSDKSMVATFGVTLVAGVFLGSFASAKARGKFRLEAFDRPEDLLSHLAGAVLMGFGGVTAVGCSIGQGVTGLAMLSAGALLAVAGISAGAVLALMLQSGRGNSLATSHAAAAR
jgi:uncharacterized membrane protein YedE/YeeE